MQLTQYIYIFLLLIAFFVVGFMCLLGKRDHATAADFPLMENTFLTKFLWELLSITRGSTLWATVGAFPVALFTLGPLVTLIPIVARLDILAILHNLLIVNEFLWIDKPT